MEELLGDLGGDWNGVWGGGISAGGAAMERSSNCFEEEGEMSSRLVLGLVMQEMFQRLPTASNGFIPSVSNGRKRHR